MATIKLRDYLLALSSKGTAAVDSDKLTILDSADSNAIKTILKSDLVDLDYLVSELQDDFLDQFGEGTFSGSTQVDHDATTNFVANEHIDHTSVSIIAGDGLTGGGDISSDRTINIVSDNNGIVVNADQIELDTDSSTFSGGVLTKMNIEQVVSGSSQISADQTDGWVGDVKTQLNSNTVVSGSSQITLTDTDNTGFDTSYVGENASYLYYTDARVLSKINTEGVLSGSTFSSPSQGTLRATINGVNSDVDLGLQSGDNVTFTDGNFTGNVVITGNLDVLGDAVEIQTSDLRIEDKLITVASGSTTSVAADGAGLEVDGADKSLKWNHSTQQFVFDAKVSSSVGFKGEGGELTGIDTDQVTEAGNLYYTDTRVKTKLNIEGVLSGSAQIATEISGAAFTSASNEFGELTLTKNGSSVQLDLSPNRVLEAVKNKEGHTLPKGTPVYISGSVGNQAYVYAASASREDRMPAAYVLDQQLTADEEGYGIALGFINGVDTSGFNEGDEVYVGINGGYTNVKPTGNSNRIQKLGNVIKSAVNGSGVITGAGRSNDVPNIQQGYLWVGGPNDVVYQLTTSSLLSANGVISGSSQIDVTQTTNYGSINQYTDSDNTSHLNSLGVVSGSSQIDVTQTTNYGSINQYTDSDNLSYLNSLLVVSASATNINTGDKPLFVNGTQVIDRFRNFHVAEKIWHSGDVDTYIEFFDNIIQLYTGGTNQIRLDSTGTIINTFGGSKTFRVESDTKENVIYVDGSTGNLGINENNPTTQLYVSGSTTIAGGNLDVSGDITGSKLSISKDVDSQNFIGRAMIGNQNAGVSLISDQATFSHIDHADYQSYGFSQTPGGVAIINHPTTQYISFRNNNTEIARFDNTDYFGINTDNPLTRLHVSGSTTIESDIRFDTGSLSQTAGGLSIYGTSATGSQYITTPGITFGWENNVSNVGISGYKATTSNTSPTNQVGMVFNTIYNGNSNDTMRLSGPSVYFNELSNEDTQLELFGNSYGPAIYNYHYDNSYSYMYSYPDYIGWGKKWGSGIANKPGGSGQSDLWMYRGNLTDAHDDYHEWKVAAYQKFKLGYTDSIISTNLEVTGDLDVNGDITGSSAKFTGTVSASLGQFKDILISDTSPFLDFVDTNSFTDPSDRFRIRANINAGLIQWYDGGTSTATDIMTFNQDLSVSVGTTSVSANGVTIEKTGNHLFLRATTAPAGEYWNFDIDANNRLNVINDNSVGVYIDDAATSWTGTSDERLKNINYELTGSLSNLQDLRAVNYSWVSGSVDKNFYGLIAQDVEEHYPDMISDDKDGYKGIRYTEMIPVLVSAIKEQQSIIDDLKSRIETLENS